jgi:hypothetical protein
MNSPILPTPTNLSLAKSTSAGAKLCVLISAQPTFSHAVPLIPSRESSSAAGTDLPRARVPDLSPTAGSKPSSDRTLRPNPRRCPQQAIESTHLPRSRFVVVSHDDFA